MRVLRCVYWDCEVIPQALHPCLKQFVLLQYFYYNLYHICYYSFFRDGEIHCLMCVDAYSLNYIHFSHRTLIDSFVQKEIGYGFSFLQQQMVPSCMMHTLHQCSDQNAMCMLPGSVGVACSPILSASFEGMGCAPVLNRAATPDEFVSIMCTFVDKTIPSTFEGS
jgi:hypothetical protein